MVPVGGITLPLELITHPPRDAVEVTLRHCMHSGCTRGPTEVSTLAEHRGGREVEMGSPEWSRASRIVARGAGSKMGVSY